MSRGGWFAPLALAASLALAPMPAEGTDPELTARLVAAARANDVDEARRLLQQGADPNAQDRASPLMGAAISDVKGAERRPAMMELLLAAGAKVNARTSDGRTTLMFAAVATDPAAMRLLLERGADPN